MGFRGYSSSKSSPKKHPARYAKGELPWWVDMPGVLLRATSYLVVQTGESQIPGYMTVRTQLHKPTQYDNCVAIPGQFGLYLGKKRVERVSAGSKLAVAVPTFWFNGRRVVSVTLETYDQLAVADKDYDAWGGCRGKD